jgi:Right handed beta helix region
MPHRAGRVASTAAFLVLSALAPFSGPVPLAGPSTVAAASGSLYVSTKGSNANSGTLHSPLRTLQAAANRARAGTTVYIRAGTYAGFTLTRSGTSASPITFRSYPGERAVISGDAKHPSVVLLRNVHDVTLRSLSVQEAPVRKGSGIRVQSSEHILITGCAIRRNNSYGILISHGRYVRVQNSAISHNATGVRVRYGGLGVVIAHNRIYLNDRMVVNDATPGNDTGGQGIAFEKTHGGAIAEDNRIWGNRAKSHDWGVDGNAFEIFGSSNVTMTGNRLWNNRAVLETGTNSLYTCADNVFSRNVAWRSTSKDSAGMVLRCAQDMVIANNTFDNLTWWAMQVTNKSSSFGPSVSGLTVVNNVVRNIKIFHLNTALPGSVQLDYNLVYAPGKDVAYVSGHGFTKLLSQFKSWTGYETHGLSKAPQFVSPSQRRYQLQADSPAIDRGILGVIAGSYFGSAPDLGRYEYRPN